MTYQASDDRPHAPSADDLWQESDCFWFADLDAGITGFWRVGIHPAANEGAILMFLATEDGHQCRTVIRSSDTARGEEGQQVATYRTTALDGGQMRYCWRDDVSAGDLTFSESFYTPRGWAKDDGAAGLNKTINDQGHLECSGRLVGEVEIEGTAYKINALAHRDRSWGVRNIGMVGQHRMFTGTVGPELSWASTILQLRTGQLHKAGFVVREGVEEDIADVDIITHVGADGISVLGGSAILTLKSGEALSFTCDVIGSFGHVYADTYLTTENLSRAKIDGMTGFCDLETSINGQLGTHVPDQHAVLTAMMENGARRLS